MAGDQKRRSGRVLEIVEAAYRDAPTDDAWLRGLASRAGALLDEGLGVMAYVFTRSIDGALEIGNTVGENCSEPALATFTMATQNTPPEVLNRAYYETPSCVTFSQVIGRETLLADARVESLTASTGVADFLAIKGMDPTGSGVVLGVPLRAMRAVHHRSAARWSRVAAHMASAYRLRRMAPETPRTDGLPSQTEGVLAPDGTILHLEGEARTGEARRALREAAYAAERARSHPVRDRGDEAIELWQGLVDGRWSLVEHFERDGRRYLVARRNEPSLRDPRALTARERQVAGYAALGHGHKLVAYELGLSVSTVRTHEARAMAKLGVRTRSQLVRVLAPTVRATATGRADGAATFAAPKSRSRAR